jgi:hypothetical protein
MYRLKCRDDDTKHTQIEKTHIWVIVPTLFRYIVPVYRAAYNPGIHGELLLFSSPPYSSSFQIVNLIQIRLPCTNKFVIVRGR